MIRIGASRAGSSRWRGSACDGTGSLCGWTRLDVGRRAEVGCWGQTGIDMSHRTGWEGRAMSHRPDLVGPDLSLRIELGRKAEERVVVLAGPDAH